MSSLVKQRTLMMLASAQIRRILSSQVSPRSNKRKPRNNQAGFLSKSAQPLIATAANVTFHRTVVCAGESGDCSHTFLLPPDIPDRSRVCVASSAQVSPAPARHQGQEQGGCANERRLTDLYRQGTWFFTTVYMHGGT